MKQIIDEMEIESVREGDVMRLSTIMAYDEELPHGALVRLAMLAAGRMMREDVYPVRVAADEAVKLIAEREIALGDSAGETAFLEDFLNSADWWCDRLKEIKGL